MEEEEKEAEEEDFNKLFNPTNRLLLFCKSTDPNTSIYTS